MSSSLRLVTLYHNFSKCFREKRITVFDVALFLLIAYSIYAFFYYCLRAAYHLSLFILRVYELGGDELFLHAPHLAFITLGVLLFWIIFFGFFSLLSGRRFELALKFPNLPFALFGSIGLGVLLLFFLNLLFKSLEIRLEWIYLPLFLFISLTFLLAKDQKLSFPTTHLIFSRKFSRTSWFRNLAIMILFLSIISDILYLAFLRPVAAGDEAYFWYSSVASMSSSGMEYYFKYFRPSNYLPGYSFIGVFFTKTFPGVNSEALFRAIPALYGLMAAWLLFGGLLSDGRGYQLFDLYALFFLVLIFDQPWIHDLAFRLWYGDMLPFLLLTITFIVIDSFGSGSKIRADSLCLLVGLGALIMISKPPVSALFLPAILPAIWAFSFFLNSNIRSRIDLTICIAFLALGAFIMKLSWGAILEKYGLQEFYSISLITIPDIQFNDAVKYLLVTLFYDYKTIWVFYFLTLLLALSNNAKKYIPYGVASFGIILSIFLLYMGPWKDVESGSGIRYILHGAYAGIFFFLYSLSKPILTSYQKLKKFLY